MTTTADIPNYISDGLEKQGPETLEAIQHRIDELLEEMTTFDPDELEDDDEEVVETEERSSGTIVHKKIPCGKDACKSCPHGPYAYRAYWDPVHETVRTKYLGPSKNFDGFDGPTG